MELFEVLHKLGSSVLYYDTDSVIFVEDKTAGHCLQTGEYLGEMTDELTEKKCSEKWIEQFVLVDKNHMHIEQTNIRVFMMTVRKQNNAMRSCT